MMTELPTLTLDRHLAAPPALVWRCWTEAALFSRWYGGGRVEATGAFDVRPGGRVTLKANYGGQAQYQRMDYVDLRAPELLKFVLVTTDAQGNVAPSPQMADWPRRLMTTVTLQASEGGTLQRLVWTPHEASAAEVAAFAAALPMLDRGWGGGFDKMAAILAELQGRAPADQGAARQAPRTGVR
jgi:uncharacterized protein YndB with AHSA1/START domain